MGRTKGKHLHVAAKKLIHNFPAGFNIDYRHNKDELKKMGLMKGSKEELNKLAGAITVLNRQHNPADVQ